MHIASAMSASASSLFAGLFASASWSTPIDFPAASSGEAPEALPCFKELFGTLIGTQPLSPLTDLPLSDTSRPVDPEMSSGKETGEKIETSDDEHITELLAGIVGQGLLGVTLSQAEPPVVFLPRGPALEIDPVEHSTLRGEQGALALGASRPVTGTDEIGDAPDQIPQASPTGEPQSAKTERPLVAPEPRIDCRPDNSPETASLNIAPQRLPAPAASLPTAGPELVTAFSARLRPSAEIRSELKVDKEGEALPLRAPIPSDVLPDSQPATGPHLESNPEEDVPEREVVSQLASRRTPVHRDVKYRSNEAAPASTEQASNEDVEAEPVEPVVSRRWSPRDEHGSVSANRPSRGAPAEQALHAASPAPQGERAIAPSPEARLNIPANQRSSGPASEGTRIAPQPAAVIESSEITSVQLPPGQPAQPIREIQLDFSGPAERVRLQLVDKTGEVHLRVRTTDSELAGALQADLGDLVRNLGRAGFEAETWTPAQAALRLHSAADGDPAPEGQGNLRHNGQDRDSSRDSQAGDGQRRHQQSHRPRWLEQLDESFKA